jgi:hypothetical protein
MLTQRTIYYPKIGKPAQEITLTEDMVLEQWIVEKGTVVKTWQTRDAGYVILQKDQKDKRGFTIPSRFFRY